MTFWMWLGVRNLCVIFIFGVYDEWRKKLGVLKKFFRKFCVRNASFHNFYFKKKFFCNFQKNFKTNHAVQGGSEKTDPPESHYKRWFECLFIVYCWQHMYPTLIGVDKTNNHLIWWLWFSTIAFKSYGVAALNLQM